jgi:uroporphyrinogen-III synthase
MNLVVTRPEGDADALAELLVARGHRVISSPMLRFKACPAEIDVRGMQAILVTSRNAIRALGERAQGLDLTRRPLFAVGAATAAEARAVGWSDVIEGPGRAQELCALVVDRLNPRQGGILHLAGDVVAYEPGAELERHGFTYRRCAVYRMEPAEAPSGELVAALARGSVDGVLLMSPRTAAVYCRLIQEAGLGERAQRPTYFCLSAAVAGALAPLDPADVRVAIRPNSEEMLALVEQVSSSSAT